MRWLLLLTVTGSLICASCSKKEPPSKPKPKVSDPSKRTMPVRPGAAMNLDKPDRVRVQTDLAQARGAIRMYQATNNGASPASMNDIGVRFRFPKDLTYDPKTGEIKSRTYPAF